MNTRLATYLALIFFSAIAGALPPLLGKWSQRQLHLFVAFGAGVFLGATFFHLLPDTLETGNARLAQFTILTGFILVLVVDRLAVAGTADDQGESGEHQHRMVGVAALIGLCLHSVTAGMALGLGHGRPQMSLIIFIAILSHKTVAAFSLATMFRLSEMPLSRAAAMVTIFAVSTPVGTLIALPLASTLSRWNPTIPMALATGTFMYVAIMNLLPEAFHGDSKRWSTYVSLALGIAMMVVITRLAG